VKKSLKLYESVSRTKMMAYTKNLFEIIDKKIFLWSKFSLKKLEIKNFLIALALFDFISLDFSSRS
jgi:hypothetical protein